MFVQTVMAWGWGWEASHVGGVGGLNLLMTIHGNVGMCGDMALV